VADIAPDPSGDLWLATFTGVSRFDGVSTFTNYGPADGLGNNWVNRVGRDAAGTVWAGTWGGVSRFDGVNTWTNFTTADGLPNNIINDIAFDSAGVWVATPAGVAYSSDNGASWAVHDVASLALPSNDARGIDVASNGDVYVATWAGLAVRVGASWTHRTTANSGLVFGNLNTVHVRPNGKTVYIGTNGAGISVYRPEHMQ
jgi:ligand-binding sensor domain-containing protein